MNEKRTINFNLKIEWASGENKEFALYKNISAEEVLQKINSFSRAFPVTNIASHLETWHKKNDRNAVEKFVHETTKWSSKSERSCYSSQVKISASHVDLMHFNSDLLDSILCDIKFENKKTGTLMGNDPCNERINKILAKYDLIDDQEILENAVGAGFDLIRDAENGIYP